MFFGKDFFANAAGRHAGEEWQKCTKSQSWLITLLLRIKMQ
jgi:hypothetical protein